MEEIKEKIGQEQFYSFVLNDNLTWQEIIHDLINTEQLDPWDINLAILSQKYIEKIKELEEANFNLSSKVLLIASIMLRLKSELLMNKYIKNLDEILFNKKTKEEQHTLKFEEYNDDEIPQLIPKTPLPRFKKISLQELISALEKAVHTEKRRVLKREIEKENYERTKLFMPKKTISITERVKQVHDKIKSLFEKNEKLMFSEFAGEKKEDKINHFVPLLHLDTQNKLWLQQYKHFEEIWIHKNGDSFIQKDDIITNKLSSQFEEVLDEKEKIATNE